MSGLRRLAHVVVEREVRADRDVVPRHEPEPRHVERHVVVEEAALVPGRIVRACAGSCGRRSARASRRRRCPRGPSTAFRMSCVGRCQSALDQSTGGCCWRQVEGLRGADQVLLRRVGREHRPHLVLLAVEPGDEEHLHRAAAIPVALLVVRAARGRRRRRSPARSWRRYAGWPRAATAICHSAVDEQPVVPTLPFDQGCVEIQCERVVAVGRGEPRMS